MVAPAPISAIPTTFNGIQFRSRLEARYAMMLHAAGIRYEYEPEGYSIEVREGESRPYLPDFQLYGIKDQHRLYAEVKPESFVYDQDHMAYMWMLDCFCHANACQLILFLGQPEPRPWAIIGTPWGGDYPLTYFFDERGVDADRPSYRLWTCASPDEDTGFGEFCDKAKNAKFDTRRSW